MATAGSNTKRDVRMNVEVATSGGDDVRSLANDIRKLGKDGSEAGAEFQRLASELDAVAAQADSIKTITTLDAELRKAATAAVETAAATEKMNLAFQEAATKTLAASEKYDTLVATQARLRKENKDTALSMAELKLNTDSVGKALSTYDTSMKAGASAILANKKALSELSVAMAQRKAELEAAEAAEAKLAAGLTRASKASDAANAALNARKAALEGAQAAAGALGVQTDNLVSSQNDLTVSTKSLAAAAEAHRQAMEESAAREAESAYIQEKFAEAVKKADAALAEQVATLKKADAAMAAYESANTEAISAGTKDLVLNEQRIKAAQRLVEEDRLLSAAQRELANSMNASRAATVAEAQALVELSAKATASLAATQRIISESKAAGAAIHDAFGVIGVRSLDAIQNEMTQTEAALSLLERRFKAGAISAAELTQATNGFGDRMNRLRSELAGVPDITTGVFERMNASIMSAVNRFGALSAAIATIGIAVRPLVEAEIELQRLNRTLKTITGSTQVTADTIEYLRSVSQKSGQQFSETSGQFSKFAAAAVSAGIPLKTVKETFEAAAMASGNLGLSSEATGRILSALGQIASKGTVQMEELRGQIGESLPGALALTAKSLGLTTSELTRLVESGGLLAKDAIPAIRDAMKTLGTEGGANVSGLVASWNRLINVVKEASTTMSGGVIGEGLGLALTGIRKTIEGIIFAATLMSEAVGAAFRKVGAIATFVADGDFDKLKKKFAEIEADAQSKLGKLADRILMTGTTASDAAPKVQQLADAHGAVAQSAELAGGAFNASMAAQVSSAAASDALRTATSTLALALDATAVAAGNGVSQWPKLEAAYRKAIDAAIVNTQVTDKLAQAKKTEGENMVAVASLAGDETRIQEARAVAATQAAAAAETQARADAALVEVYKESKAALEALAKAEGSLDEGRAKRLAEYEVLIQKAQADAEKTNQVAAALDREAASRRIATEALRDNSGKLSEYRDALDKAYKAYAALQEKYLQGKATLEEVRRADVQLAEAEARVKDALNDTAAAAGRKVKALQDQNSITLATLNLQKANLQAEIAMYEATGQGNLALDAKIKLKELEVKILQATIDAKLAEIKATRLQIEADVEAMKATGQYTEAKQAEIEARLAAIKVKELEAEALRSGLGLMQKQIDNLRMYGTESVKAYTASAKAVGDETAAVEKNTKGWQSNYEALVKSADARKGLGSSTSNGATYDSQGWATNTAGERISARANTPDSVLSTIQSAGYSSAEAQDIAARAGLIRNGQVVLQGEYAGMTLDGAIAKALAKQGAAQSFAGVTNTNLGLTDFWSTIRTESGGTMQVTPGKKAGGGGTTPLWTPPAPSPAPQPPAPAPAPAQQPISEVRKPTPTPIGVYRVIIENADGTTTAVDTASQADATGLVGVLKALGEASRRSA